MGKTLLTKERIEKSFRMAQGVLWFIIVSVCASCAFMVALLFAIIFSSFSLFLLLIGLIVCGSIYMLITCTKYTMPEVVIFQDTLTAIAVDHENHQIYGWFQVLNDRYGYGWIKPTSAYHNMKAGTYYIFKERNTNRIIATYEARLYELDENLKSRLQSVDNLYFDPQQPVGLEVDCQSIMVEYKPLI